MSIGYVSVSIAKALLRRARREWRRGYAHRVLIFMVSIATPPLILLLR